jgi:amino acid transporter
MIVGLMLLFTCQALAEMAVLYPVNGAFFTYVVRFVDPALGFAVGWDYALSWLTILPFELIAAGITIQFWRDDINIGVWIAVFLVILSVIQVFGVRGYGEVEFVLSIAKILACIGFIILGIVINCGGTSKTATNPDYKHYLGARYWHDPGAFHNGFNGFCGVFVVASFAFGGTELVGLAAAESENPRKAIPMATKQVFWRICFFYVVNLFILGLIVKSTDERLIKSSGANTKYSPFVIAIQDAGIKVLPSIFNAVITIAVISVANSCTFGSTRTIQALAERGMAPKLFAYVDKHGRPIWCVVLQISFGLLAFIGESGNSKDIFNWLLALSGLGYFFIWGSICLSHIRFRAAWKLQGYSLDAIPYKPSLGIYGSWVGLALNCLCLIAAFYNALYVRCPSCLNSPSCGRNPNSRASVAQTRRNPDGQGFLPGLSGRPCDPVPVHLVEGHLPQPQDVRAASRHQSQDWTADAGAARDRRPAAENVEDTAHAYPAWSLLSAALLVVLQRPRS